MLWMRSPSPICKILCAPLLLTTHMSDVTGCPYGCACVSSPKGVENTNGGFSKQSACYTKLVPYKAGSDHVSLKNQKDEEKRLHTGANAVVI